MSATRQLSEFPDYKADWVPFLNGVEMPLKPGDEVSLRSKKGFGSVAVAIGLKPNGTPAFDRILHQEKPYGQYVVWGRDANGTIRIGLLFQPRPWSDAPGEGNVGKFNEPVTYVHGPMGFKDVVQSKLNDSISAVKIANGVKEATEELGGGTVLSTFVSPGIINAAPSFNGTVCSDIVFIEYDLASFVPAVYDPSEPIAGYQWFTICDFMAALHIGYVEMMDGTKAYPGFAGWDAAFLRFLAYLADVNPSLAEAFDAC